MKSELGLSASQEDYLEAIYNVSADKQAARAKDIAQLLNVNSSSVTGALRSLSEKGLINYAPYDLITLTAEGREIAEDVVRRHEVLRDFFVRILGVDPKEAEEGACTVEHGVPRSVLDNLIRFVEFLDVCPRAGASWMESFREYCKEGVQAERCVQCTFQCLENLKDKRRREAEEGKILVAVSSLPPGRKGKVIKIKGRSDVRNAIVEQGVEEGFLIELDRTQSGGDQIDVKVRGYRFPLRKNDAKRILVEMI